MCKRLIGFVVLFLLLAVPALAEPISLTIAQDGEHGSPEALASDYLKKLIAERSGERIKPIPIATSATQLANLTIQGLTESSERLPQLSILELPLLFRDRQHLHRYLDSAAKQRLFRSEATQNLVPLSFWDDGFRQLATRVPVTSTEQFIGLTIRRPLQTTGISLEQAITARWQTSNPELQYNSQIGYDILPSELLQNQTLQVNYLILSNHILTGKVLMAERSFWDHLPEDLRIIVMGAVVDATLYFRELAEQEEQQILNTLAEQQIEILQLSADQRQSWQTEMQKTYPQLLENLDQQLIESIRAH